MLELCGMQSTPSFSLLPGPLWPEVVAPDWVLSMGQIELLLHPTMCKKNNNKLCTYVKLHY